MIHEDNSTELVLHGDLYAVPGQKRQVRDKLVVYREPQQGAIVVEIVEADGTNGVFVMPEHDMRAFVGRLVAEYGY